MPLFPFHIWLPEAHVEAPTAGSVLLAGILLKLGSYSFLRFSLPFFPDASLYFAPFVFTLSIIGIIFTSLTAIRQTDRSEEHTSELQSLMRISYAVFCLIKKTHLYPTQHT